MDSRFRGNDDLGCGVRTWMMLKRERKSAAWAALFVTANITGS
jgi:hypothetical protein